MKQMKRKGLIAAVTVAMMLVSSSPCDAKSIDKDEEATSNEIMPVVEIEAKTEVSDATSLDPGNNNAVSSSSDSYSLYKQLMEVRHQLTNTDNEKKEPAAVTSLKSALSMLYDSLVDGVFQGFFPHVERQRRDASDVKRVYLDVAVTTIGAVMGKQNCSRIIACR